LSSLKVTVLFLGFLNPVFMFETGRVLSVTLMFGVESANWG